MSERKSQPPQGLLPQSQRLKERPTHTLCLITVQTLHDPPGSLCSFQHRDQHVPGTQHLAPTPCQAPAQPLPSQGAQFSFLSAAHSMAECCSGCCPQSCSTLCDSVDCRPPGSSVHQILQARILQWVAVSFSRGFSQLNLNTGFQSDTSPASPADEFFATEPCSGYRSPKTHRQQRSWGRKKQGLATGKLCELGSSGSPAQSWAFSGHHCVSFSQWLARGREVVLLIFFLTRWKLWLREVKSLA